MSSPCEVDTVCSGDRLISEHATRVSWWLASGLVVLALVFVGVIGQHAFKTHTTGPWSALHASSWIQPTPRALASLVGIALVLDIYISYMMALRKGHLDRFVGQFLLGTLLRTGLWLFFLYGLAYGGYIGSMFAVITLALMLAWGFMSSHSYAPFHSWLSALEFVFVIFLTVWLATSNAKVWPSA
jgi:hypothetical protein